MGSPAPEEIHVGLWQLQSAARWAEAPEPSRALQLQQQQCPAAWDRALRGALIHKTCCHIRSGSQVPSPLSAQQGLFAVLLGRQSPGRKEMMVQAVPLCIPANQRASHEPFRGNRPKRSSQWGRACTLLSQSLATSLPSQACLRCAGRHLVALAGLHGDRRSVAVAPSPAWASAF